MINSRITTTATNIPEKLREEIGRAVTHYNNNTHEAYRIVFLEIDGIYYKGRVFIDDKGNLVSYVKLTIEKMRDILTAAAQWRTRVNYSRYESGWVVKNGGRCPRYVAYFAIYEMPPEDLPDLPIYSLSSNKLHEESDTG